MKKKQKKKKKKIEVEIVAGKKGKVGRPALSSSVSLSHILKELVHKKWLKKSSRNHIDGQTKKLLTAKGLKKKKDAVNHKDNSKLTSRNRRELEKSLPVHGILKNRTSRTSKKENSSPEVHGGNLMNHCCESEKHVSFSIKDVMLRRHKSCHKSCSQMELSHLQSLCRIVSDVLADSSAIDCPSKVDEFRSINDGAQVFTPNDKYVASSFVEQVDGSQQEQAQLSCSHGHATSPILEDGNCSNRTDTQKSFLAENLDLNAMQNDDDIICVNPFMPSLKYSDDPKAMSFVHNKVISTDAGKESFLRASNTGVVIGPCRKPVSGSDTVSSLTMTSTTRSKHPVSCLSLGPKMNFYGHLQEFQPMDHHLSPKDLISSICSSVGSKKSGESSLASDPGLTSKDKFTFDDFIGLPLNSQGELIKLHSGAKFDLNGLYMKQNTELGHGQHLNDLYKNSTDHMKMKGKFCSTEMYPADQPNWFPDQYCPASKPVGISELQGFERWKIQNQEFLKDRDQFVHRTESPMVVSCHGCRESVQIHSCNDRRKFHTGGVLNREFQPVAQPTMRLMGQNVTVGKSNFECQAFDDARSWTSKDVTTENYFPAMVSTKRLPEQWIQHELIAPPPSRNPPFQPLEAQLSMYHKPPLLPRSNFGCQPQWMTRDGIAWINGYRTPDNGHLRPQLPNQVLLNETSKSVFRTVSETDPIKMRQHLPLVASHPQSACHPTLFNSTHCKHTQSVSYSSASTSNPPIRYRELNPSPSSLTQWLLNTSQQQRIQQSFCRPYSRPVGTNHHHGELGTGHIHHPSPYTAPTVPFPVCNSNTPQIRSSIANTDYPHPSFPPGITANRLASAVDNTSGDKNKNISGTRSELKVLDHADQPRKRPAGKEADFMKPLKRPFSRMHDGSNASTCHRRKEQLHGYTWHNIVTPEYHMNSNTKADVSIPAVTKEKEGLGTASGSCSVSRPGPIKLSAGAKHILKPSLDMNQDCPRTIHSTLPFSAGTSSDMVTVSRKKAAKVYRF